MMVVRAYEWKNMEYVVLRGWEFMPGANGIRLLADRREGFGADRVIVLTGMQGISSFRVFTAEGKEAVPSAEDAQIFARHLLEENLPANAAMDAAFCRDSVLGAARCAMDAAKFELRLTSCFVERMRATDAVIENFAC